MSSTSRSLEILTKGMLHLEQMTVSNVGQAAPEQREVKIYLTV